MSTTRSTRVRGIRRLVAESCLFTAALCVIVSWPKPVIETKTPPAKPTTTVLTKSQADAVLRAENVKPVKDNWHQPHVVKCWTTTHKGRTFRVTQLPRCEHLEMVITYEPSGETLARAKTRSGGVAACTGSFHNSKTMALADFLQREGSVLAASRTCRPVVSNHDGGRLDITDNVSTILRKSGVSALQLGQRLVPLQNDGFSAAFMNRVTDRMAIGLNGNFIFIVQGRSDIWRLSHFMSTKLPVRVAVNSDGGHVVKGKAPVHLVFRWKTPCADAQLGQVAAAR